MEATFLGSRFWFRVFRISGYHKGVPILRTGVVRGSILGSPFRETTIPGNPDFRCTWGVPNIRARNV